MMRRLWSAVIFASTSSAFSPSPSLRHPIASASTPATRPSAAPPMSLLRAMSSTNDVADDTFEGDVLQNRRSGSLASYAGALDQGTSSTRFVIFDKTGGIAALSQKEHTQYYPQPGWVEHDAEEIWKNSVSCISEAMDTAKLSPSDISSIGITNQRETTVVWDKNTGEPLHKAVVWNCVRSSDIVSDFQSRYGGVDGFRDKTGLPISTYFSATKLRWLFENCEGLKEKAESGDALFGTIDCCLTWKLTNGKNHATDITNAGRTLLCDIATLEWDDELLGIFDVPKQMLPIIQPSIGGDFGTINNCEALSGVPIGAILGDQHAATFGQTCFNVGDAKCTFGTGAFIMMNMGEASLESGPIASKQGLLTTPFYQIKGQSPVYALEGAVAVAGSLIQWLRDNLEFGGSAEEIGKLASSVSSAEGIRFVPAFNGLFAPHWREDARGTICGLTFFHTKAHLARAAIDASSFQTAEVFDAMELDSGIKLSSLKVDGGMTVNQQLLQFLADILGTKVSLPKVLETTAAGVAYAAGLSTGLWESLDDLSELWAEDKSIDSEISEDDRNELKQSWKKAIDRSLGWEN